MNDPPGISTTIAHSFSGGQRARSPFTLPLPGAPAASLDSYKARFRAAFAGANPRVCAAFWLFGSSPYLSRWKARADVEW